MATGLRKLKPEERTGTFGVGYGSGTFHMKLCTVCGDRKYTKGAHYIRGHGIGTSIVKFVCADCWPKVGADKMAPNAQVTGASPALMAKRPVD
jgi:hypothetical protein